MKVFKKNVLLVLMFALCLCAFACTYTPPGGGLPDDGNYEDETLNLEEQSFDSALEAYVFGENFFNAATHYETVTYGAAAAMSTKTYSLTKTYKSDTTNDYLYETANFGQKIAGVDTTFALKVYKRNDSDTVHFARVNGTNVTNGAKANPNYSTETYTGATAEYANVAAQTKADIAALKADVTGANPMGLTSYIINESTIKRAFGFEKDKNGFAYVFKLSLNEGAVADYKRQVGFFSNQTYKKFNPLSLNDGLVLQFMIDKYGRILRVVTDENYNVTTPVGDAAVVLNSTQYISYSKKPSIDILKNGVFNGPKITYAGSRKIKVSFDSEGGGSFADISVAYNSAIGLLPKPVRGNDVFAGWYTERFGKGELYNETSACGLSQDGTLYAHWYEVDGNHTFALAAENEYRIITGSGEATFAVPATFKQKPVTAIEGGAYGSADITALTIPASVKEIGQGAFNAYKLTSLNLSGSAHFKLEDGVLYTADYKRILFGLPSLVSNATSINENVEEIDSRAFYKCAALKNAVVPGGVAAIGEYTFYECSSLDNVVLPDTVLSIGKYAFFKCSALSAIDLPDAITSIELGTFRHCVSLAAVIIPANVEIIHERAFSDCSNLKIVTVLRTAQLGITALGTNNVFASASSSFKVYVYANSLAEYQAADNWKSLTIIAVEE